jgi:ABC-2 type transport system ATP-binding protein
MDSDCAIILNKLSKQYQPNLPYALKDLSIRVRKGEVYGFLGPNGAGKSTTIRLLLNFIQPSSGSATILGLDVVKDSVLLRQKIGYLSGDFKAYDKMTGEQFLAYMNALQPVKRKAMITQLAKTFNANLHKRIRDLSKGNRQKIGIIQACMHEPEILILDEPTDGLDPLMQEAFYNLVNELQANGSTIFVSSHNLTEVQKMCDKVAIIRDGKLVGESDIADLATEAAQTFEVSFKDSVTLAAIRRVTGVKKVSVTNGLYSIHVHGELSSFLAFLSQHNVQHFATKELNLEEEFMKFYETGGHND